MKFRIEIEIDNAAFEGEDSGNEVSKILGIVSRAIEGHDLHEGYHRGLFDVNGNRVGNAYTD